jgi:hypothetical protein
MMALVNWSVLAVPPRAVPNEKVSRAAITAPPIINRKLIAIALPATLTVHPYAKAQHQKD